MQENIVWRGAEGAADADLVVENLVITRVFGERVFGAGPFVGNMREDEVTPAMTMAECFGVRRMFFQAKKR